jgi:hypothetical protein
MEFGVVEEFLSMEKPFEINFEFPVAHSDMTISIRATAELHHSDPYYIIHSFYFPGSKPGKKNLSLLPVQEIRSLKKGEKRIWVHRDSGRESLLSKALGRAIENLPEEQKE